MKKFKVALVSAAVLAGIGLTVAPASAATKPGKPITVPGVPVTPGVPVKPGKPITVPGVPVTPGVPITPGVPAKPGKPGKPGAVQSLAVESADSGSGPISSGVTTCGDQLFGGTFYCGGPYGSGSTFFTSRDGTRLILVVGTNHAVYTRSTIANSTKLTAWTSLGGNMAGKVEITAQTVGGAFRIDVPGADGRTWSRARDTNGSWTAWTAR
ncbi:hypothetical protein AB0E96_21795 [Kitasatospora sp. NPDC036755]|uniref:hypothetical protein n=1 Tax=Kitasatospora sp. NPDC036755 TaxID=3154600 RepID=UPI0033C2D4D3